MCCGMGFHPFFLLLVWALELMFHLGVLLGAENLQEELGEEKYEVVGGRVCLEHSLCI